MPSLKKTCGFEARLQDSVTQVSSCLLEVCIFSHTYARKKGQKDRNLSNPSKMKFNLNRVYIPSPYRAVNTLRPSLKKNPVS